jgi:MSHA biogenesis protein MshO
VQVMRHNNQSGRSDRQSGFTLLEMVITIVVSSIMAIGIVSFIGDAVTGFISAGNRNQLSSAGRTVVDRIALELHNALPNSIRVTTAAPNGDQCLEFIPFLGASSYVNPPFTGTGGDEFEVINFNPSLITGPASGLFAVIYPIDLEAVYEDPIPASGPRAAIDEISDPAPADGRVTITLTGNHRFSRRSPVDRIYVTESPVSFCISGNFLFRYQSYGFEDTQPQVAGLPATAPDRVLISDSISNAALTAFTIQEATLRRNAIVSINLNFVDTLDTVRLQHEVQIRNVP